MQKAIDFLSMHERWKDYRRGLIMNSKEDEIMELAMRLADRVKNQIKLELELERLNRIQILLKGLIVFFVGVGIGYSIALYIVGMFIL